MSEVRHCFKIKPVSKKLCMDGVFNGFWTGFQLKVKQGNKEYLINTAFGCKGINCPVKVFVENGFITDIVHEKI
jgi:hypothetical protein